MSDQGCLFSLDISQHGGMAFKKALDTCVRAAELQGERLTGLAAAASVFEINVGWKGSQSLNGIYHLLTTCTQAHEICRDLVNLSD